MLWYYPSAQKAKPNKNCENIPGSCWVSLRQPNLRSNAPSNNSITPDITIDNGSEPEIVYSLEGFSHQEMKLLTDLSLSSIRSKASRGKVITAKDGFTYLYDKNPQILKWLRT